MFQWLCMYEEESAFYYFFFFQAEDGIRDFHVTGVQTCALPIFVAVDLNRRNDVIFQKTLSVNDWYHDGGDGFPLGAMQLIGKVQGVMMKTAAPRAVPRAA